MALYDRTVAAVQQLYARGISTAAILDTDQYFPGAATFQTHWQEIRNEAAHVAENLLSIPLFHDLVPNQESISAQDERDWRMFVLKAYGIPVSRNLRRCPVLANLLAEDPSVLSAAFSYLAPGKHIPEHSGLSWHHPLPSQPERGER